MFTSSSQTALYPEVFLLCQFFNEKKKSILNIVSTFRVKPKINVNLRCDGKGGGTLLKPKSFVSNLSILQVPKLSLVYLVLVYLMFHTDQALKFAVSIIKSLLFSTYGVVATFSKCKSFHHCLIANDAQNNRDTIQLVGHVCSISSQCIS